MAAPEKDEITGQETTGHSWDGIQELDTPLPLWWLIVFYASIIWAIGYWVVYPAWPSLSDYTKGVIGYSSRASVATDLAAAKAAQQGFVDRIAKATPADIEKDPKLLEFALAGGKSAFGDNCAPCHGSAAQGSKGYPNLADDDWLWGGRLEDIQQTIRYGIRANNDETRYSEMPAFGRDEILSPEQISDVAEFVLSLSGRADDAAAAKKGAAVFAENCVDCHGAKGTGNREFGAPNLADAIWLYGGDKKTIVETVTNARRGVMPNWDGRLPATTIKQLAIYVHALGGGE